MKQNDIFRLALQAGFKEGDLSLFPSLLTKFADLVASELRRLHAENEKLLAVLEEAEYALDYAADMTKPEGLSGCDCPICTASIRIGEVLAGKRRQA